MPVVRATVAACRRLPRGLVQLALGASLAAAAGGCGARDVGDWAYGAPGGPGSSSSSSSASGGGAGGAGGSGAGAAGAGAKGGGGAGGNGAAGAGGSGASAGAGGAAGGGGAGGSGAAGAGGSGAAGAGGSGGFAGAAGAAGSAGTGGLGSGGFGGAGGSGAAGGAGGGTGGAGGEATEICVNFLDDDLDGLPDCTDPACKAEFLCAPPPEVGWQGPVALWQGPGDAPAPSCAQSGGYEQAKAGGKAGLSVPPVACADCACGPPKGVACQVTTTGFFATGDCSGPKASLTVPVNVCQGFVTTGMDPASARWESAPAAGGACLPQQLGSHQIPPLVWSGKASTCGEPLPTGGGCGPGVCVPRPHAPFGAGLCIYHDGNQSCPSGPYAQKLVYYAGADDSRQCSGCTCLDPTGTSCQGTTALYTDTGCTVDQVVLSQVGQCAPLPPDPTPPPPPYKSLRSMIYVGASAGTGSCAPVPSQASGGAVESGPITFCCF